MPKILINYPDGTSAKFGLNGKVFTIGRAENNDIVLRDGASSSYHAVLKLTDCGDFAVSDLESTNHTKVNGQIVSTVTLMNGDVLQFGDTQAKYESDVPIEGRVRDNQQTQIYEQPRPQPVNPQMPVFVNQPPRQQQGAASPAPVVVAAQPYVIQRPVSTMGRRGGGDGCFALVVLCFLLPVVFFAGATVRHYQDHDKQWFWDYLKEYLYGG
ncbi:MAG TPA: FHA domain-containing protein [Verrucomicrobiales bacterium]|nr:FHA domain-containing protein [Verrucomicrobiales bacterium]